MIELTLPYLKALATQTIFVSSFLGGFSAAILGTLIISKRKERVLKLLISGTAISSISFIVAICAMTKLFLMATPGYPFKLDDSQLIMLRIFGVIAFFSGIIALMFTIGASGWVQSKRLGRITALIASVGFFFIIVFLS